MFEATRPHYCPGCEPTYNKLGEQTGEHLHLTTRNYSGTGADVTYCHTCKQHYTITYKMNKVDTIRESAPAEYKRSE